MPVFTLHQTEIKSDHAYSIEPINTKSLKRSVLKAFERVSFDISSRGSLKKPFWYAGECDAHDHSIHGASFMQLENASSVKSLVFLANETVLCRASNYNRDDTISLNFIDNQTDCLLVDSASLVFSSLYFTLEHFEDAFPRQLKFSFIPLLLNRDKIGNYSNLIGFDYYTELLDGEYLLYSGGGVARRDERPNQPRQLCESVAVKPSWDKTQKYLTISCNDVENVVAQIPDHMCVQKGSLVYNWVPPHMQVMIFSEYQAEIEAFCRSKDPSCIITDRGYRDFYTAAQEEEMRQLSNRANDVKYRCYCRIQDLDEAPSTSVFDEIHPPQSYVSVELSSADYALVEFCTS